MDFSNTFSIFVLITVLIVLITSVSMTTDNILTEEENIDTAAVINITNETINTLGNISSFAPIAALLFIGIMIMIIITSIFKSTEIPLDQKEFIIKPEEVKDNKQTYEEYVKERLEVERVMK